MNPMNWFSSQRFLKIAMLQRWQRGVSIIEFSVAFPILLLFLGATFDLGFYLYRTSQLKKNVYDLTYQETSRDNQNACEMDNYNPSHCSHIPPPHQCALETWCSDANLSSQGLKASLAQSLGTSTDRIRITECSWKSIFAAVGNSTPKAPYVLEVGVDWNNPCFFCGLFPFKTTIAVKFVSVIEGCI